MKLKVESFFINVGITIVCYIVFIVFTSLTNYFNNKTLPTIGLSTLYIFSLFLLIRYFNKSIYNISVKQFIGNGHLKGILTSILMITIVFTVPYFAISDSDYIFSWNKELIESIISNSIVAISEELIFRAFFFLSMIVVIRKHLISALLASLVFTFIHFFRLESVVHFLWIFSASMLMTYIYYATKSLFSNILFHMLINVLMSYVFVSVGQLQNLLITQIIIMSFLTIIILFLLKNKFANHIH